MKYSFGDLACTDDLLKEAGATDDEIFKVSLNLKNGKRT